MTGGRGTGSLIPAVTLAARLAPIALPDTDGRRVVLGDLWTGAPAVLVFLRHYG